MAVTREQAIANFIEIVAVAITEHRLGRHHDDHTDHDHTPADELATGEPATAAR